MTTGNNVNAVFIEDFPNRIKSCKRCKEEFKHGDRIFRKRSRKGTAYHIKCWEKLLN